MKSALELALEKTAAAAGDKLTAEQKKEIEEIRSFARSKVAEEEILIKDKLTAITDPQQTAALKEQSAARIRKIREDADAKVERLRKGRS